MTSEFPPVCLSLSGIEVSNTGHIIPPTVSVVPQSQGLSSLCPVSNFSGSLE